MIGTRLVQALIVLGTVEVILQCAQAFAERGRR